MTWLSILVLVIVLSATLFGLIMSIAIILYGYNTPPNHDDKRAYQIFKTIGIILLCLSYGSLIYLFITKY